jgi:alpha-L-fucosidase
MAIMSTPPIYLNAYGDTWKQSAHAANLKWFKDANFGLFIHYGLYSQLGRHEWVQFREQIPVSEYEKLYDTFNPSNFDADFITDMALDAGMTYVNLTSCHHEGFCLWNSRTEAFNSWNACGRDLVQELGEQCARKGLGFFTYYTHVLNWRHPYMLTRDTLHMARPDYPNGDPRYKLEKPEDNETYWEYAHACIAELAERDFPLAGIWLDLIAAYYLVPDRVPIERTYELIRAKRPDTLISFKQGATGTEDFASPEFHFSSQGDNYRKQGNEAAAERADAAWEINRHKHNEICMTLQQNGWGYVEDTTHKDADTIWGNLAYARSNNCNLLANVGPLADGSIHPEDVACLKEIGRRIRTHGMPAPDASLTPSRKTLAAGA